MPRGRQTDEEQLRRVEDLFFERYSTGQIAQGYKEVDNVLYVSVRFKMLAAGSVLIYASFAQLHGDNPPGRLPQVRQ
jgi:hypothetical protein